MTATTFTDREWTVACHPWFASRISKMGFRGLLCAGLCAFVQRIEFSLPQMHFSSCFWFLFPPNLVKGLAALTWSSSNRSRYITIVVQGSQVRILQTDRHSHKDSVRNWPRKRQRALVSPKTRLNWLVHHSSNSTYLPTTQKHQRTFGQTAMTSNQNQEERVSFPGATVFLLWPKDERHWKTIPVSNR